MIRRGKKAATHIGVVLSFVIFITFLAFMYTIIIEPTVNKEDKQSTLENLKGKLIKNISEELITASITTNNTINSCIRFGSLINSLGIDSRIIVKDELKNNQQIYVLGNDLEISRDNVGNNFFKIYNSAEFQQASDVGESPCNSTSYVRGLIKVEEYVFETKVIDFINNYETNYETLKNDLKIPTGSDFGFGFIYPNKTIIKTSKETTASIYATEIPVQYIDKNANILLGTVNIRIW